MNLICYAQGSKVKSLRCSISLISSLFFFCVALAITSKSAPQTPEQRTAWEYGSNLTEYMQFHEASQAENRWEGGRGGCGDLGG